MIKTSTLKLTVGILLTTFILAACGGGGGGGAAEPTQPLSIVLNVQDGTLSVNSGDVVYQPGTEFATLLTITARQSNGQLVNDGTVVSLSVSNTSIGLLSTTGELGTQSGTLSVTTTGGSAQAVFHANDGTGSATVTASIFDGNANRTVSSSQIIQVAPGNPPAQRLTLTANRTSIPARPAGVPIFFGSRYIAEVDMQFREEDGDIITPAGGEFGVSIAPVDIAAFSTPDDGETDDVNEFLVLLTNGPIESAGGGAKAFVHSFDSPGQVTLTVTAQDPNDGENFSEQIVITVTEPASDGLPASVTSSPDPGGLYIQGSGGTTAKPVQILVVDGAGEEVPDPAAGVNNVQVELITAEPNSGEILRATNGSGANVQGTTIQIATTTGVTSASLISGTEPNQVTVRVTADAADNNVGNGIQAPVVSESSVDISDGIPFAVRLSSLPVNSLTINPVDPSVTINDDDGFPVDPNATYSLRVNALVTDRAGNPPANPVTLRFGLADAPLNGFPTQGPGVFFLSGTDGNPTEGGTRFSAPDGAFLTAGGGAGPGDTLIIFGEEVIGNKDLEGAREVVNVIDQNDLTVDRAFNLNDVTGVSVNDGPVLPYIIGRAENANIESNAVTDSNGVASTLLNYPVSQIGRSSAIYVQGSVSADNPTPQTIADASLIRYPALAPASMTVSPSTIQANRGINVLVCVFDALSVPIQGQFVSFAFNLSAGTGRVDGVANSGITANATDADGCVLALVTTTGIPAGSGEDNALVFSAVGASAEVEITSPENAILQLIPSAIIGDGTNTITIRYLDEGGNPIEGIGITGTCMVESGDGTIIITTPPGTTDVNGETTARITTNVNSFFCPPDEPPEQTTGSCEFTTATGDPTAILPVTGIVIDGSTFSPPCT